MKSSLAPAIDRLRSRVAGLVFVHAALKAVGIAGLCVGVLILLARVALAVESVPIEALAAALVPVCAWAAWRARGRRLSRSAAAAWLDVRSGGAGRIAYAFERGVDDEAAVRAARGVALPKPRLGRPLVWALAGIAFVAATSLVPVPRSIIGPPLALQEAQLARAREKLATLESEIAIDPQTASDLHAQLERLENGDGAASAASTFEALDAANAALEAKADSGADALRAALEGLEAAAELGGADAAQAELENALRELSRAGLDSEVAKSLESATGEAQLSSTTKLDANQIAKLSNELSSKLGDKLEKLARAGLLKDAKLARIGEVSRIDPTLVPKELCPGCKSGGVCTAGGNAVCLGNGDVSRGRGDAPMIWGDESTLGTGAFEATPLPEATRLDLERSGMLGVSAVAPNDDPVREAAGAGALENDAGRSAWRRRLAPRHRDAVQDFFTRELSKKNE